MSKVLSKFSVANERKVVEMTLEAFLDNAKTDPGCYATAAERMIKAIGKPELVDTSGDPRLSRIFQNRTIKVYPAFNEFYGIEDVIEKLVGFFVHAAQGLEEAKQVLYLLGPVGAAKSSLAERIKYLMQKEPIYVLAARDEKGVLHTSPCFESPLGLFNLDQAREVSDSYKIPYRYFKGIASPWAVKRLDEFGGDISKFSVVKVFPDKLRQIAISKTEPGDDNNQDISSLVGKVDLRKLDKHSQSDTDAYSYSGALNRGNQGVLEFVEMFKAPIKTLHPLLTATQEGNYVGTEEIGAIPFQGIILAHSNESEWQTFRNDKNNEAFLDRIYTVKVPYCLRVDDEIKIYQKMLDNSELSGKPIAPETLEMLAKFSVLSRLKEPKNSSIYAKLRAYNGEKLTETDTQARTITEYLDDAGVDEGMAGLSTRFAFKVLSKVYNHDPSEISADPVHLILVLMEVIKQQQFGQADEDKYTLYIRDHISKKYAEQIGKVIQEAFMDSYGSYGQGQFDKYVDYAEHWSEDNDYKDPDTGIVYNKETLHQELQAIELPAGISNYKDFRNEVVRWVLKARAKNGGKNPDWKSYQKLRDVIEKKMFSGFEELLPVISFSSKKSAEHDEKHTAFVDRMKDRGYTNRQTRRLVEWWMRYQKAG